MNRLTVDQCRKLKELGAPQELDNRWCWVEAHRDYELNNGDESNSCAAYSLEEMIDWLGDEFGALQRDLTTWPDHHHNLWKCWGAKYKSFGYDDYSHKEITTVENDPQHFVYECNTPLEAVYELCLAVKGKEGL